MTPEEQIKVLAAVDGYEYIKDDLGPEGWYHWPSKKAQNPPDYLDLNDLHRLEMMLDEPKYSRMASSRSRDHAPMRYIAEICKLKRVEELVLSVDDKDRGKLNFRPGPYPMPIQLPPSAIVLGHSIPAYGHELCLIRANGSQRREALAIAFSDKL